MATGGDLKYWLNGLPFSNLGGNDPSKFDYWFNGLPFVTEPTFILPTGSVLVTGQKLTTYVTGVRAGNLSLAGWDSSRDYFGDVSFSNGDKTASATGPQGGGEIFSLAAHNNGKYYAEVTFTGDLIGISSAGFGVGGTVLRQNGDVEVYPSGGGTVTYPAVFAPLVPGDIIGMAVDVDAGKIWFRVNGGRWNNSSTQSPDGILPAFSPNDITGLKHWLDASQLALTNDAVVDPWPNLASGAQPTIVDGTDKMLCKTNTLNGKPVVRFNTNGSRLRSAFSGASVHDFTVIYLVRWLGVTAGRAFSVQYPTSNFLIGMHGTGKDIMYDNGVWISGPDTSWASWSAPGPWRLYCGDAKTTVGSRFFIDGTLIGTAGGTTDGLTNGWGLSGYDATGVQETMPIEVAELVIYDRQIDVAERNQVQDYLRAKWGLPAPEGLNLNIAAPEGIYDPMDMP